MKILSVPHTLLSKPLIIRRKIQLPRWNYIKDKIITFFIVILVCLTFLQCGALWREGLIDRLANSYIHSSGQSRFLQIQQVHRMLEQFSRHGNYSAAHSFQGRMEYMEDRFALLENINNTGIDLFGVFDGHGGSYSVLFLMKNLLLHLLKKILDTKILSANYKTSSNSYEIAECYHPVPDPEVFNLTQKSLEFQEFYIYATNCLKKDICLRTEKLLKQRMDEMLKEAKNVEAFKHIMDAEGPKKYNEKCYIENGQVNYRQMLIDEFLYFDHVLVKNTIQMKDKSGTTALIAIVDGQTLTIANVGDSRAVICDQTGNPIQLTVDHSPSLPSEQKRILENGGFVASDTVNMRVNGYLAVSRALGDYDLKKVKLVIPDPDIFTYDLSLRPRFLILACDGFWRVFPNVIAIEFAKRHLHLADFGASKMISEAYRRGSLDNLTVVVIVFDHNTHHVKIKRASTRS